MLAAIDLMTWSHLINGSTGVNIPLYFAVKNYLGTILVLMNFEGNIVERYNYDAWERRRNPDTWEYTNVPEPTLIDFGYTGHEHWDKVNIINMTGRLYDPYISDPESSQALNRYTYVNNNPLIYNDPTGEVWQIAIYLGWKYLKTAHDNRDRETGKWDWKLEGFRAQNGDLGLISYFLLGANMNFNGGFSIDGTFEVDEFSATIEDIVSIEPERTGTMAYSKGYTREEQMELGLRYYGGDYSGSFKDNIYFIADALNQINPIALGWDAITGYSGGTDRFGNPQSNIETTIGAASVALPLIKGASLIKFNPFGIKNGVGVKAGRFEFMYENPNAGGGTIFSYKSPNGYKFRLDYHGFHDYGRTLHFHTNYWGFSNSPHRSLDVFFFGVPIK